MSRTRVTIKFIAQKAGMSFSTVAKALQDDPAITHKTRERIKGIARQYNYRPNILAKALRSRRTRTIGVILNDLQSPFYSEIYKAIGDVLNTKGYTMLLADSSYDEAREKRNISTMISQGVEGIIISSVSEDSRNIRLLLEEQVKTVFIDSQPAEAGASYVYVDHQHAARMGSEYLVSRGHQKILLLNGPQHLPSSRRFREGYLATLNTRGLPAPERLIKHNPISIEDTCSQLDLIQHGQDSAGPEDFTAMLALSDVIAMGVYESAMRHGFSIPGTYSVVGYDNILATRYLKPALTTIHQPKEQTGRISISLLMEQIETNANTPIQVVLDPQLIERDSVQRIA
ncbi:MAG: LacI family transcriptional regulator [Spirochaetaceae bacterium]|nr:MAG: LacI family transcriptional regulator [Spirochaetaceae bacterium]